MIRSRAFRLLGSGVVAVTVLGGGSVVATSTTALATTTVPANVQRIAGASRLATAIATSQDEFPATGSAIAVVLTRSDTYPDALSGGPLAAKVGGPLLLTPTASLDPTVKAEIVRVLPAGGTVYILGGTAAVSTAVETTITGLGFVVKRIAGADRFATAVAVADALGDPTTVFEATGLNFPDALSGGPAAIKTGGAILLTDGSTQSPATAAYLAAHPGGTHYALGGPAAAADPTATSLAGQDRYETSDAVAFTFFESATKVGAATGLNFPDALAAGPDLAAKGAPLLLVPSAGALPEPISVDLLARTFAGTTSILLFGGTASVSDDVASQLGVLGDEAATTAAATTAAANTGQFGILAQQLNIDGLVGKETDVVDGLTGAVTAYKPGAATDTSQTLQTRAQLATLPLTDPDALIAAVNTMFATADSDAGLTGDADTLFTLNAEQITLNPVASPSLRLAVYAALASDDGATDVTSGVKDSMGRVGIEIFASTGATAADKGKISYIFDPVTLLPLEDSVIGSTGAVVERQTILSLTTSATAPPNPFM
jgi:putative cell wall-binding protein